MAMRLGVDGPVSKYVQGPLLSEMENGLSIDGIEAQIKFLAGSILTVVDASYSDTVQREAVKSLVKGKVRDSITYLKELSRPYRVVQDGSFRDWKQITPEVQV